jgi:hypothetical protein
MEPGTYQFDGALVEKLIQAKLPLLTWEEFKDLGFKKDWFQRKTRREGPKIPDLIRLAVWLDVPVEVLCGAAPEYAGLEPWEVAARASLVIFLARDSEGREVRNRRVVLEENIERHGKASPRTVLQWRASADLMLRGTGEAVREIGGLNRAVREDASPS